MPKITPVDYRTLIRVFELDGFKVSRQQRAGGARVGFTGLRKAQSGEWDEVWLADAIKVGKHQLPFHLITVELQGAHPRLPNRSLQERTCTRVLSLRQAMSAFVDRHRDSTPLIRLFPRPPQELPKPLFSRLFLTCSNTLQRGAGGTPHYPEPF